MKTVDFWFRHFKNDHVKRKRYSFDLVSHLAICDANYERLLVLMPELRNGVPTTRVLHLDNSLDGLTIESLPAGPYTDRVEMSHRSVSLLPVLWLSVHVYHDLRVAEVKGFQNVQEFRVSYPYPNARMKLPDEKVQVNLFCAELLNFCLTSIETTRGSHRRPSTLPR